MNNMAADTDSTYGRILPLNLVDYRSKESKTRLCRALSTGTAVTYLALSSCFSRQLEPAYCGLTTLSIVLNALQIDPQRIWKTPWRWYSEELLDCCCSLEDVKKVGITLEEFKSLAECNGAVCKVVRPSVLESDQQRDYEQFRKALLHACTGGQEGRNLTCEENDFDEENPNEFIALSYSRKTLAQTGEGHFSPIAAVDLETDSALVFDTARFKYPPYWVPIELLFQSMLPLDPNTKEPRGYFIVKASRNISHGRRVCCMRQEIDQEKPDMEITSWKVRAYDFYLRVVSIIKRTMAEKVGLGKITWLKITVAGREINPMLHLR